MRVTVIGLIGLLGLQTALAAPIVYPASGQSAEQQQEDDGACYVWAKNETGVDPAAGTPATAPAPDDRRGGAVRGAAGGAAIGAIVGDSDDAAKGAAAGAVLGRMRQNRQNRAVQEQHEQQVQSAQAHSAAELDNYHRAYKVCMEGRGYTVSL